MKQCKKRIGCLAVLFALVLSFTMMGPVVKAKADGLPTTLYYSAKSNQVSKKYNIYYGSNTVIKNAASSNPKVLAVKSKKAGSRYQLSMTIKKTGTATITFTEVVNGHEREVTYNYQVKAYTSPVKSIKIGNKNLTSQYKNSRYVEGGALKGKLKVTAKKGWKCIKAYKFKVSDLTKKDGITQIPVKLKKNVTLKKGDRLTVQFKKGDAVCAITYTAK